VSDGTSKSNPPYLEPYLQAASRHGGSFGSLLWASPRSQATRFRALTRAYRFKGKSVLDAGCGRADFLDYLIDSGLEPDHYVGLEAVDVLADAAEQRHAADRAIIVRADFVREPARMLVGADVVVFSGSLNTLAQAEFERTLRVGYEAATEALVFNFLSSPRLAGAKHLTWHEVDHVTRLVGQMTPDVTVIDDYMDGDATVVARRPRS
jgi:SAM-dependent methyltransferase